MAGASHEGFALLVFVGTGTFANEHQVGARIADAEDDLLASLLVELATGAIAEVQNLWWATGYNAVALPLAAGALYRVAGILLSPALGAVLMSVSTVIVAINAQLLGRGARTRAA